MSATAIREAVGCSRRRHSARTRITSSGSAKGLVR